MKGLFSIILVCLLFSLTAQDSDVNKLIQSLRGDSPIASDLRELCDEIGGRETGSKANYRAIQWGVQKFKEAGLNVSTQDFMMPELWLEKSTIAEVSGDIRFKPTVVSKFHSPTKSFSGEILDGGTGSIEEFGKLGTLANGAFILIETDLCLDIAGLFAEYTQASKIEDYARSTGARGIIFMSSRPNGLLYRFVSKKGYENEMPQIVMAREDAKRCLRSLREGKRLKINVVIDAEVGGEFKTQNVIAEIKGSEKPNEIVVLGAHLDSWALGTGANDNGCNVAMVIDIARQMIANGIKPKRTIRFALWNGEEPGFYGSKAYVEINKRKLDKHIMAMSVDIGSGSIFGFFTNGRSELQNQLNEYLKPVADLGPYTHVDAAIVGTDNFDFMLEGVPNLVANHKSANYGQNYHASSDTYDKVNLKSLKLNSTIVAAVTLGFANSGEQLERHNRSDIEKMIKEQDIEFSMRMFNVWDSWVNKERGRID